MGTKERSPDQTATSLSIEKDLLSAIDQRAGALGLTRSGYLALLARNDISQGGPLIIKETNHTPTVPLAESKPTNYWKSKRRKKP